MSIKKNIKIRLFTNTLLFLVFFFIHFSVFSQTTDTIPTLLTDSTSIATKKFTLFKKNGVKKDKPLLNFLKKKDGLPNPNASLALSLIMPGAGQLYNGRWWKLPFVYGAFTGLYFVLDNNVDNYLIFRTAYKRKQMGLEHYFSGTRFDDAGLLKSNRDQFDKNRQLLYVGVVVLWLINGVEAFTDAHLLNFDVDDDLSFRIKPTFEDIEGIGTTTGIGIVFNLTRQSHKKKP